MAVLKRTDEEFVLITPSSIFFTNEGDSFLRIALPTNIAPEENLNKELVKQIEQDGVCADLSPDNRLLAICSKRKLFLYSAVGERTLLSARQLSRAASKVRFVPSGLDIIISDKSGDVYSYSVKEPHSPGVLLLGHLSVIIDVLTSCDEKYILSCDRDEKIRISKYPNAYNIVGFCLGHTEFVSCMEFLPSDPSVLVSASGDGTLKCWKWSECQEIHSVILKSVHHQINECAAVSSMQFLNPSLGHCDLLFLTVSGLAGVFSFKISLVSPTVDVSFIDFFTLPSEPVCLSSRNSTLFILTNSRDCLISQFAYEPSCKKMNKCKEINYFKDEHVKNEIILAINNDKHRHFDHLFKKRFDNVQEYLEKKKARLELSK